MMMDALFLSNYRAAVLIWYSVCNSFVYISSIYVGKGKVVKGVPRYYFRAHKCLNVNQIGYLCQNFFKET